MKTMTLRWQKAEKRLIFLELYNDKIIQNAFNFRKLQYYAKMIALTYELPSSNPERKEALLSLTMKTANILCKKYTQQEQAQFELYRDLHQTSIQSSFSEEELYNEQNSALGVEQVHPILQQAEVFLLYQSFRYYFFEIYERRLLSRFGTSRPYLFSSCYRQSLKIHPQRLETLWKRNTREANLLKASIRAYYIKRQIEPIEISQEDIERERVARRRRRNTCSYPQLVEQKIHMTRSKLCEEFNMNLPILAAISLFRSKWSLHGFPIIRFGRKIGIYYQPDLRWLRRVDSKRTFLEHDSQLFNRTIEKLFDD